MTPELANRAIQIGRVLGVEVTLWDVAHKFSTKSRDTLCPWPFERAFVSSDMRVVPCCQIGTPEVDDRGDAHNFTQVWNSETYREFRREH